MSDNITPLTPEELAGIKPGMDLKKVDGEFLTRASKTFSIEYFRSPEFKDELENFFGDKLERIREEMSAEVTRRILENLPQQKAWAESNLISRDATTGKAFLQPQAVKAMHFEDFDKATRAILSSAATLDQRVETLVGDALEKERALIEENNALDLPIGRHMAKTGITPRWIYQVRKGRIYMPDPIQIKEGFGQRGTVVVGSGAGSYLTFLQELAEFIDYIYDESEFYARARHIPVPTGSIRIPRRYRNTSGLILGTTGVKTEGSAPGTEGTMQADRLTFSLLTIAGYITASDEIAEENQIGIRQMVARDLRRDVMEKIEYFSMIGSGSSEPLGLFNTVIDSSGTTSPHSVAGNHNAQWDDIREAAKKMGGERFEFLRNAVLCGAKSAYFDFYTRQDAFNNYIMRSPNVVDTYPWINASDATSGKAALVPPQDYWFAENLALTTMAMGIKEGKALWTEGELLFYMGVRYDSKHKHYKITSAEPNDCSLVFITGLNA